MRGTITKIDQTRRGKDRVLYQLIIFKLETGRSAGSYLCETYKNYARWRGCLEVGAVLDNLQMTKDNKYVDAHSYPVRVKVMMQPPLL
jgi:hypothetical protein